MSCGEGATGVNSHNITTILAFVAVSFSRVKTSGADYNKNKETRRQERIEYKNRMKKKEK